MALRVKDVAEMLKVSTATVSLVLNNKPGVSEETRQRVLKLVQEMGYDTNILSKPALKNSRSIRFIVYKKHGNVVSDTPFFSSLIQGIEQESRKDGYNLLVSYMNEDENKMEVLRMIQENLFEGLIILATEMTQEDVIPFTQLGVPVVLLDNCFESQKQDTVVIDNLQGAYEAVAHLINAGHKKIGYLRSSIRINNFEVRQKGFLEALQRHGLNPEEKYTFSLLPTPEGSYADMLRVLKSGCPMPSAFFADNDIIAFGAIKALRELGIKIPEDVSVIGFDDMPFCEIIEPSLTTVKVYSQRMGMLAVKRLLEKIGGDAPESVRLEVGTLLVARKSVLYSAGGPDGQ